MHTANAILLFFDLRKNVYILRMEFSSISTIGEKTHSLNSSPTNYDEEMWSSYEIKKFKRNRAFL